MKFISKSANLNIILRPGMQAQPLTGAPAIATIFVRFKDGIADVDQNELITMMLNHPGFNQDFVAADEEGTDPYAHRREEAETKYVHEEIEHGSSVRSKATPVIQKGLPPAIKKMIQDQAAELAKKMLPDMVKAVLEDIALSSKEIKEGGKVKKSAGKPVGKTTKTTVKKKSESVVKDPIIEEAEVKE